ncbi:MAG: HAD family hydrolase [Spirochaetaceae bacterium]|nr:HAD family hydrolase [Spirochaetaceae bacterium]
MKNLIFDVDGTLVDTYPGIKRSVEEAIGTVYPGRGIPEGATIKVGPRIREIMRQLLGELPLADVARLEAAFRESYDNRGWADFVTYPGVLETLAELKARADFVLFVVTNKPELPTSSVLRTLGIDKHFTEIVCPNSRSPKFPDKRACLEYLVSKHRMSPVDCLYIGDTQEDRSAAHGLGIGFIGVEYGYGGLGRTGDCYTIETIHALIAALESADAIRDSIFAKRRSEDEPA